MKNTMELNQLREWVTQHVCIDMWHLSVDGVVSDKPLTVDDIESRITRLETKDIRVLHFFAENNPAEWMQIERRQDAAGEPGELPPAQPSTAVGDVVVPEEYRPIHPEEIFGTAAGSTGEDNPAAGGIWRWMKSQGTIVSVAACGLVTCGIVALIVFLSLRGGSDELAYAEEGKDAPEGSEPASAIQIESGTPGEVSEKPRPQVTDRPTPVVSPEGLTGSEFESQQAASEPGKAYRWNIITIGSGGPDGMETSLSYSTEGQPAIAYESSGKLSLAEYDGSQWKSTIIDKGGRYNSISHDPKGRTAVSYSGNNVLRFARYDGEKWLQETVDTEGNVGEYTSLSHAPNGNPAISYYDRSNRDLKYAEHNGTRWVTVTIDSKEEVGRHSCLHHAPDGQPAISYYDETNGNLKFARRSGKDWMIETVDSDPVIVGMHTSLNHTPDGKPAISYYDSSNRDLKYAANDGVKWIIETIDTEGTVGEFPSLRFNPEGQPTISYIHWGKHVVNFVVHQPSGLAIDDINGKSSSKPENPKNFNDGLVAYYPFNGDAKDESGNGNDGEVKGATLTTDRHGRQSSAYSFAGNEYIAAPPLPESDSFSASGWLLYNTLADPSATGESDKYIFWQKKSFCKIKANGKFWFNTQDGDDFVTSSVVPAKTWHHFVCVADADRDVKTIWIDGVKIQERVQWNGNTGLGGERQLLIGVCGWGLVEYFIGKIDDIRIYNRALSPEEITNLYASEGAPPAIPDLALLNKDRDPAPAHNPIKNDPGAIPVENLLPQGISLVEDPHIVKDDRGHVLDDKNDRDDVIDDPFATYRGNDPFVPKDKFRIYDKTQFRLFRLSQMRKGAPWENKETLLQIVNRVNELVRSQRFFNPLSEDQFVALVKRKIPVRVKIEGTFECIKCFGDGKLYIGRDQEEYCDYCKRSGRTTQKIYYEVVWDNPSVIIPKP